MIRAGLLDRRVVLQRRVEQADSHGQAIATWVQIAEVWARVEPLGGREGYGQQQFVATGDLRFTLRWRPDVTPLERIVYDGRDYDIVSVADQGRHEALLVVGQARAEGE